ncbi:MAG: calcium/sodium antiporter [Treponema sp.]|nr:calcium/sodium antiporter [Treponema sp.]
MLYFYIDNIIGAIPHDFGGIMLLFLIIAISIVVLGKGSDILVDNAVKLSLKWGVPKMIIGATIVSLGTTLPEFSVSVMSAINGLPGIALGNAVGSVICNTGLIIGIASILNPLPFKKDIIDSQSFFQLASGILLIISSLLDVFVTRMNPFNEGSILPQWIGFVFLSLLFIHIIMIIKSAKLSGFEQEVNSADKTPMLTILFQLLLGIILIILSSKILIPSVKEFAQCIHIPDSVIAATVVAFGTSLPELITAITASRKGHGDLVLGNILGANVLNILFVIGTSVTIKHAGLNVDKRFFIVQFPAMLFILLIFHGGVNLSKGSIKRPVGIILLVTYIMVIISSYIFA